MLHNEELQFSLIILFIIVVIKSRKIRWPGHVARVGQMRNAFPSEISRKQTAWVTKAGVHGRITLIWIFKKEG
jgi:hypothetical protein